VQSHARSISIRLQKQFTTNHMTELHSESEIMIYSLITYNKTNK